jgi:hypothetical protein
MIKIAGSGSISQRHGSPDPDPHQNVMDPEHCFKAVSESKEVTKGFGMLANCMSGMKLELSQFQMIWERYSEIWTVDREEYVDSLARKKPRLKDFEEELHRQRVLDLGFTYMRNLDSIRNGFLS